MDIVSFIIFSVNTRYMLRCIAAGLMLLVPILNFLSIGYLSRASNLFLIGGIGLPTWEEKGDVFRRGAYLLYIMILYLALPSFLFSCWFLLVSFGNFFAAFMGGIMKLLSAAAFVACSFFIPFAFCAFSDKMELRRAFDFEAIVAEETIVSIGADDGIVADAAVDLIDLRPAVNDVVVRVAV